MENEQPANQYPQAPKSKEAIRHFLERIQRDKEIRWHFGFGSRGLEVLCAAWEELTGQARHETASQVLGAPIKEGEI